MKKKLFNIREVTDYPADGSTYASKFKFFMHNMGFDRVWLNQCTFSKTRLVHSVFNKLKDSYSCYWKFCIFDDSKNSVNYSKLRTYRTVKISFKRETYL